MKLFLDDSRQPQQCTFYMRARIGNLVSLYNEAWEVVKTYEEFIKAVEESYQQITHVSFDHDLADIKYNPKTGRESFSYYETTGYDCAVWFKNFYKEKNLKWPVMFVHSGNGVGTDNIIFVFKNDTD